MVVRIPLRLLTHTQKISSLYKKWLRHLEGECSLSRELYRFKATLVRAEFNCILYQKDMRISKQMLLEKEEEFNKTFFILRPLNPDTPGGTSYDLYVDMGDWMLDFWHPLEKAHYPEYFAKRELRKQQYIDMWEKEHGPPPPFDH